MIYRSVLFLCLFLPFQLALNPTEGIDLASVRIFILALFFVWLADGLKNRKLIVKHDWQTALVTLFLVLNVFSVFVSRETDWSVRKLVFLLSIFPLYFVLSGIFPERKAQKMMIYLVAGSSLLAILGLIQFFFQFVFGLEAVYEFWARRVISPFLGNTFSQAVLQNPSWLVNISGKTYLRATATFPDPHMLAFYLGMIWPVSVGMWLESRRKIFLLASAFIFLADLLTFSRGAYLGLAAGMGLMVFFFWNKIGNRYKIGGAAFLFLVAASLFFNNPVSNRFRSIFDFQEGSNKGRIAIWKEAIEVVRENPITGVGLGNYPKAINPLASYRDPIYAHNAFLDIAAETGVLNSIIWAGLLLLSAFKLLRSRQEFRFMVGVGIIIYFFHSLVETAIYSPTVLSLILIFIYFSGLKDDERRKI